MTLKEKRIIKLQLRHDALIPEAYWNEKKRIRLCVIDAMIIRLKGGDDM